PRPDVLAVRVANLDEKDILLSLDSGKYFTEPHYNGFPAVLFCLDRVNVPELRALLINAWRCQAPRALARTFAPDESLVDALMTAAEAPQPGSEPGAGEP